METKEIVPFERTLSIEWFIHWRNKCLLGTLVDQELCTMKDGLEWGKG